MHESLKITILDYVLPYLPKHGNFDLKQKLESLKVEQLGNSHLYHLAIEGNTDNVIGLIEDFLIKEGFASKQSDGNYHSIIELSDKGRELKKCGSYKKYLDKVESDDARASQLKKHQEEIAAFERGEGKDIKIKTLRRVTVTAVCSFITLVILIYNTCRQIKSPDQKQQFSIDSSMLKKVPPPKK